MIRLCTPAIAGIVLFGSISVLPAESLPRKIAGLHEFVFVMAARIDALVDHPFDSAWLPQLPPPKDTKRKAL